MAKGQPAGSPFLDVTPPGRRPPSWIAKHRTPAMDLHALKPAPIPQEFVEAIQAEIAFSATKLEETVALQRAARSPSEHPAPKRGRVALPRPSPSVIPGASSIPASMPGASSISGSSLPAARRVAESELPSSPFASQLPPAAALQPPPAQISEETREALHQAIENLVHARSMVLQTAAGQLAELAATIARRVISHELGVNHGIVRQLVDEGLQALEREDRVLVRIGPGFAQEQPQLLQQFATEGGSFDVVVDSTLSHFGCVVETEHGWVDESIESRLATLLQELRGDSSSG